ncbi:MAG TPA: Arc family DNA-binding protein, partial [Armatimonadota bacterium]|nr:Arc family DNA-binding protein [Armatimonadota bacterium]
MASLTIKGIPDSLLEALRARAEQHRRSLNSEVLRLLENSTRASRVDPGETLTRIHRLQERTRLPPLTDAILGEAVDEGRP